MHDYRKWKKGNPRVVSLLLDTANPRIPRGRGITEQRDLIEELVEHDNVYELARDIATDGYYPLEFLIAIEDDGKAVVVEGNRRLAALKLLINPELAPEVVAKKFKTLSSTVSLDLIAKVPTIYAPSRGRPPLIMQKHTRQQVERWSVLMQASFYKSLAESGVTLAELAEQYGRPPSEIAGFLRTDTMYAIACSLDYPDDVAKIVRDPREFPAAVLQRVLDIPKAREFFGIEFKEQVKLHGKVEPKEFKRAYAKVIADIATQEVDTRKLNKVDDVEQYLSRIGSYKPKKGSKGNFDAESFDISVPDLAKGGAASPASFRRTKRRKSLTMIPAGVRCDLDNERIVDVFNELRKLRTDQFPNACAVLLRILLELCVGKSITRKRPAELRHYLQRQKKRGKNQTGIQRLRWRALLGRSSMDDPALTITVTLATQQALTGRIAAKDSVLSLDDLDGFVHSAWRCHLGTGAEPRGSAGGAWRDAFGLEP